MCASKLKKFSDHNRNSQGNMLDLEDCLAASSRPLDQLQRRSNGQNRMLVSQYEQLMVAGRPKMLSTGKVRDQYPAFYNSAVQQSDDPRLAGFLCISLLAPDF